MSNPVAVGLICIAFGLGMVVATVATYREEYLASFTTGMVFITLGIVILTVYLLRKGPF